MAFALHCMVTAPMLYIGTTVSSISSVVAHTKLIMYFLEDVLVWVGGSTWFPAIFRHLLVNVFFFIKKRKERKCLVGSGNCGKKRADQFQ